MAAIIADASAQSLSVQPIEVQTGKQTELVVNLTGGSRMTALQFNLQLPEGVTAETSSATLGPATNAHTLSVQTLDNGDLLFILYSKYLNNFHDGELLRIPVTAGSTETTSSGKLYTVRTATVDAVSHTCAEATFSATVSGAYKLEDGNGDGDVNVTDYLAVANYILGLNTNNFDTAAADVNSDNSINVSDYVGVANIILYGNYRGPSANAARALYEEETSPWMEVVSKGDGRMNLILHDVNPFSAFQMDIKLPEGVEITNANMATTNQTRNLGLAKLQNDTWRLLYGTLENKVVDLMGNNLLTLELAGCNSSIGGLVTFDNILLADDNASVVHLNAIQCELPTGINFVEKEKSVSEDVYDLMGRKLYGGQVKKDIYIINGQIMFVK